MSDEGYKDWEKNLRYTCAALNPDYRTCAVPDSCCLSDVAVGLCDMLRG